MNKRARWMLRVACYGLGIALTSLSPSLGAQVTPAQRLGDNSPSLDAGFGREAWLVYTYSVDTGGRVVDARIRSSNGVESADRAILEQVEALRFDPATRNGSPYEVTMGPVAYTWILDIRREMSPGFGSVYDQAWDQFRGGNYPQAASLAKQLGAMPGRNAYEEVKYHVLAASLAARQQDAASEMRHLKQVMALQDLADRNDFEHPYVEPKHYALMLVRLHELLLDNNQLADAQTLFSRLLRFGVDDTVLARARTVQQQAQVRWNGESMVTTQGQINALYPGGEGSWKAGLSRDRFSIESVKGNISWVFLTCGEKEKRLRYPSGPAWQIPPGWQNCLIDVGGEDGTRFDLQQLR